MEDNAITALRLAGDQAVGFGLWSLFIQADLVVKVVLPSCCWPRSGAGR